MKNDNFNSHLQSQFIFSEISNLNENIGGDTMNDQNDS